MSQDQQRPRTLISKSAGNRREGRRRERERKTWTGEMGAGERLAWSQFGRLRRRPRVMSGLHAEDNKTRNSTVGRRKLLT